MDIRKTTTTPKTNVDDTPEVPETPETPEVPETPGPIDPDRGDNEIHRDDQPKKATP